MILASSCGCRLLFLLFFGVDSLSLSYLRHLQFLLLLDIFHLIGVEVLLSIEAKHGHVLVMLKEERVLELGFEREDQVYLLLSCIIGSILGSILCCRIAFIFRKRINLVSLHRYKEELTFDWLELHSVDCDEAAVRVDALLIDLLVTELPPPKDSQEVVSVSLSELDFEAELVSNI